MISSQSITSMQHAILKELESAPFDELALLTESGDRKFISYDLFRRLYNDAVESMNSYMKLADDYRLKYEEEASRNSMLEQDLMELSESKDDVTGISPSVHDFLQLTDDMIHDILTLNEELVRWRQALLKYLPKEQAECLRYDIFDNTARSYAGDPAYDLYVKEHGSDPQHSKELAELMIRLADGTDETSINHL